MNQMRRHFVKSGFSALKGHTRLSLKFLWRQLRAVSTIERAPGENPKEIVEEKVSEIPTGILGQPTCHTHPHLISKGYLTCGIKQAEYVERRDTLMTKLLKEHENENLNHVVVIPGAVKKFMSEEIPYVFRQHSDFFYLTGCLEPGAVLVMVKPPQTDSYKSHLFVAEKDSHAELWEGPRTGCEASTKLFAVNESKPISHFAGFMNGLMREKQSVIWSHMNKPVNSLVTKTIKLLKDQEPKVTVSDPQRALHSMRVIKSPAEIELMRDVCFIGAQSVNMAMACTKPGVSEHSVLAVLDFTTKQGGGEHLAFPPVVAGGERARHIHYINNNQILKEDEMLLVDTGAQRWLYNSDLSRTWPVSGTFQPYHRILYEIVLSVQKRLITLLGESRQPLDQLFEQMCRLLGTHLQQEGILPKNITNQELMTRAYQLCPHHVSHYLGLDVHDSYLVRRNIPVQTNMVVTVEPGIYIRPDDTSVPEEFRGVGIRIEDDVLITDGDPEVLTQSCVKEVDDIESLVGRHKV